MHDPQMHPPDIAGVVVEKRHRPLGEAAAKPQLLADLPPHGIVVGRLIEVREAFIRVVHMATDADRGFCHQPLLAGLRTARVMQDAPAMAEDRVRDDLLERGILLRCPARNEEVVLLFHEGGKVVIHPPAQALKAPQAVEKFPLHHQYLLLDVAHGRRHCRECPNPQGKTSPPLRAGLIFFPLHE